MKVKYELELVNLLCYRIGNKVMPCKVGNNGGRLRIIARRTLLEFSELHSEADQPLKAWYAEAKSADWSTSADVKSHYNSASILQGGRVIFNISGNKFRLVVHINFEHGIIYIRFVGTHTEYDKIDVEAV